MANTPQNPFADDIYMAPQNAPRGPPPATKFDADDTLRPHRWDAREWRKRTWAFLAAGLIAIIVIIVVVVVEVKKQNRYPDYTPLKYSLADTCACVPPSCSSDSNRDAVSGTGFFDNFDYFTGYDPAQGFVHYVPAAQADSLQYNLTTASASSAVLKVDTTVNVDTLPANASTGRFSVRIQSKKQYASGLFVFDVIHTPLGCATWPALWLSDPANWPANGEIDVMEAVNVLGDAQSQVTLHTAPGCSMGVKRKESGKVLTTSCVNSTDSNAGCGVDAGVNTFGSTFNSNGGGIAAMELRSEGIRVWQFPRASIPSDISSGNPDPSTWGEATADFPNTDCDIGTHFRNQSIIANIDLCGSWAGDPKIYGENCKSSSTYKRPFTRAYVM